MVNNKIKVGMVGISFGMEFIPIYMKHPDVYEIKRLLTRIWN